MCFTVKHISGSMSGFNLSHGETHFYGGSSMAEIDHAESSTENDGCSVELRYSDTDNPSVLDTMMSILIKQMNLTNIGGKFAENENI